MFLAWTSPLPVSQAKHNWRKMSLTASVGDAHSSDTRAVSSSDVTLYLSAGHRPRTWQASSHARATGSVPSPAIRSNRATRSPATPSRSTTSSAVATGRRARLATPRKNASFSTTWGNSGGLSFKMKRWCDAATGSEITRAETLSCTPGRPVASTIPDSASRSAKRTSPKSAVTVTSGGIGCGVAPWATTTTSPMVSPPTASNSESSSLADAFTRR